MPTLKYSTGMLFLFLLKHPFLQLSCNLLWFLGVGGKPGKSHGCFENEDPQKQRPKIDLRFRNNESEDQSYPLIVGLHFRGSLLSKHPNYTQNIYINILCNINSPQIMHSLLLMYQTLCYCTLQFFVIFVIAHFNWA